jgi:hypothetical protein
MKKFHVLGVVFAIVLAILYEMETDTATFSAVQSAIFPSDHRDLFHFVSHPDTVEMVCIVYVIWGVAYSLNGHGLYCVFFVMLCIIYVSCTYFCFSCINESFDNMLDISLF